MTHLGLIGMRGVFFDFKCDVLFIELLTHIINYGKVILYKSKGVVVMEKMAGIIVGISFYLTMVLAGVIVIVIKALGIDDGSFLLLGDILSVFASINIYVGFIGYLLYRIVKNHNKNVDIVSGKVKEVSL